MFLTLNSSILRCQTEAYNFCFVIDINTQQTLIPFAYLLQNQLQLRRQREQLPGQRLSWCPCFFFACFEHLKNVEGSFVVKQSYFNLRPLKMVYLHRPFWLFRSLVWISCARPFWNVSAVPVPFCSIVFTWSGDWHWTETKRLFRDYNYLPMRFLLFCSLNPWSWTHVRDLVYKRKYLQPVRKDYSILLNVVFWLKCFNVVSGQKL